MILSPLLTVLIVATQATSSDETIQDTDTIESLFATLMKSSAISTEDDEADHRYRERLLEAAKRFEHFSPVADVTYRAGTPRISQRFLSRHPEIQDALDKVLTPEQEAKYREQQQMLFEEASQNPNFHPLRDVSIIDGVPYVHPDFLSRKSTLSAANEVDDGYVLVNKHKDD